MFLLRSLFRQVWQKLYWSSFRGPALMKKSYWILTVGSTGVLLSIGITVTAQHSVSGVSRVQWCLQVVGIAAYYVRISVRPPPSLMCCSFWDKMVYGFSSGLWLSMHRTLTSHWVSGNKFTLLSSYWTLLPFIPSGLSEVSGTHQKFCALGQTDLPRMRSDRRQSATK